LAEKVFFFFANTVQTIPSLALIGAGGFGTFVFHGLGQAAPDLILLGAIPVILMALAVDILMQGLISLLPPKGFSGGQR
jgi:osmoprotectant transport system permease protein